MKDFTIERTPALEFTIDSDTFRAAGDCPGGMIEDLAVVVDSPNNADKLRAVMTFLDQVLEPESADRFAERLRSATEPISFGQAVGVFEWLIETYTSDMVPTTASSSSHEKDGATEPSSSRQPRSTSTRRRPASAAV